MSIHAIATRTETIIAIAIGQHSILFFFIYPPLYFIYVVSALLYSSFLEKLPLELLVALLLLVDLQHIAHPIHLYRSCKVRKQVLLRVCCVYATLQKSVHGVGLSVFNILLASSFEAWEAREDPRVHRHKHLRKAICAFVHCLACYDFSFELSRVNVVDCRLSAFSSVHCLSPLSLQ